MGSKLDQDLCSNISLAKGKKAQEIQQLKAVYPPTVTGFGKLEWFNIVGAVTLEMES